MVSFNNGINYYHPLASCVSQLMINNEKKIIRTSILFDTQEYPDRTSFRRMQVLRLKSLSIRDGIIRISSLFKFDCPPRLVEGRVGGSETNPFGFMSFVDRSRISRIPRQGSVNDSWSDLVYGLRTTMGMPIVPHLQESDKGTWWGIPAWGMHTPHW